MKTIVYEHPARFILHSIGHYPSISPNKMAALVHVFGGSLDVKDGVPSEMYDDHDTPDMTAEAAYDLATASRRMEFTTFHGSGTWISRIVDGAEVADAWKPAVGAFCHEVVRIPDDFYWAWLQSGRGRDNDRYMSAFIDWKDVCKGLLKRFPNKSWYEVLPRRDAIELYGW